jgi:VanZ family protein
MERWLPLPLLDAICVVVLCILLTLGLWPFHSPANHVTWLGFCNGLTVRKPGTVIGAGPLPAPPESGQSTSVEIWLQPERVWDNGTILAFYPPGHPHSFSLYQSLADLELQTETARLFIPNAFRQPRPVFLTIVSTPAGTAIYANGALARSTPRFRLSPADFTGRLILGDAPAQPDNWSGLLLGLAIYRAELTPARVQRHYQTWTRALQPEISPEDRNIALYLFEERDGRIAHSRAASGPDLNIPEKYSVLDKLFLEPFWKEFAISRSYVDSAVKNIVGFLPFGFCFYPCLLLHQVRRPALVTVALGLLVSLTIEVLQTYLPTRDSGMTDLFTNTLGAWLGVLLFRAAASMMPGLKHRYQTNLVPKSDTVDFR